jgi:hypothetical protein
MKSIIHKHIAIAWKIVHDARQQCHDDKIDAAEIVRIYKNHPELICEQKRIQRLAKKMQRKGGSSSNAPFVVE